MPDEKRHTPPPETPPDVRGDGAPGPDGSGEAGAPPAPAEAPAERRRPWWAKVLIGAGAVVAVLVALVLVALLVLTRTEWGRQQVQGVVVAEIQNLLAEGATVEVDRLEGNFLTGARLVGLVIRQDGEVTATIDTVAVEYNLITLLQNRFSADELYVGGPTVYARQAADSTWNLAHLFKPADPADTTASILVVHIDSLGLKRGRVEAHFYAPDRDSVLTLSGVRLVGSAFHYGPDSLTARIDTVVAQAVAPGEAARLALAAGSGVYTGDALALGALRLTSAAGTDVRGEAEVAFTGDGGLPPLNADLALQPLALADVRAFTGLDLYGDPRVRLTAQTREGAGGGLSFSLQGAVSGGTVALDGTLRNGPGNTDRLEYQVQGQLRGLNPALITQNPALDAEINAELEVDVTGTSLRTLDGPFGLVVTDSRVGRQPIERVAVEGAFHTGRVTFDAAAAVPGARLRVEGEARPFDPTPTYDAEGVAEEVDLARLTGDPNQTLAFSGAFAVSGAGFTPETANAQAELALDRVRFGRAGAQTALDYLDANAELRAGTLRFVAATEIAGGGGTVEATGTAQPFADPLTYDVTSGRVEHLDLAVLTGDPSRRSDLTGTFALQGTGTDPQTASLAIEAALRNSTYGVPGGEGLFLDLVALDFDGTLRSGVLGFDAAADLGRAGRLQATGTARPLTDPIVYEATGQVENLDLAELTGNPSNQSDVTAAFRAEGRGTDPQTLALTAHLDLAPSSYGAQEVTGGTLDLALRGGELALTGDVTTPEGEFALNVSGRPFDATPTLAFGEGTCFSGLDLAALTGNPDLRSRLAGCFRGSLTGFDLATAVGEGTLTITEGTFNDARIADGLIAFTLRDGLIDASAHLAFAGAEAGPAGALDVTFAGRPFAEVPTYDLAGTATGLDPTDLLGVEVEGVEETSLSLRFDLQGRGTDPETMTLDGFLAGGSSKFGDATVDTLRAGFALDRGVLVVDTLLLRSNVADATGSGRLVLTDRTDAPPTDFDLHAEVTDLAPLSPYLPEPITLDEGTVDVAVTGEPGGPLMFDVATVADRLAYGTTAVDGLDSRVTGTYDPTDGDLTVRARVEFDFFSQPGLLVEQGDLEVIYAGDETTIEGDVTLDRTRDFQFFARLDFNPEAPSVLLERLALNIDGEPWALAAPTRITYGGGAYRVDSLLLVARDGSARIAADGVIDPDGAQDFRLTIEDLAIDGISDLLGYEGLGGRLSTSLALTGPAEAPVVKGSLTLADFTSRGRPVGSLHVLVDYARAQLGLDARLTHVTGRALTATGVLPVRFSLAAVATEGQTALGEGEAGGDLRFVVRADSFPVAWARPFLDPRAFTALDGALTADVTLSGTQAAPRLDGDALLTGGRLGLAAVGRIYETITVPIRFVGNQALIEQATIRDPEGGELRLEARGSVTLPELSVGELDLTLTPHQFTAITTPTYDGLVLDAAARPIRLTGTLDRPVLRGAVRLAEGDIYLTDELVAPQFEDVTLTDEQLRELEARFGRRITARDTSVSRFTQAMDLDLEVQIERDVWLRSTAGLPFDIEFRGDVRAVKPPFAEGTELYGAVEVTRGSVQTLGRRFQIESGTLVFNGPTEETEVDLRAVLDIRTDPEVGTSSVQITLAVDGRLGEDLAVRLSSDPALDNADIVSLIATGRLAEDFFGGGALAGAGQGLLLGQLTSVVEGAATDVGLDVVQIDQEPGGLVIRLGKYLTNKAFLTFGYPIGGASERRDAGAEVTLEYALLRWLLAQVEYEADVNGTGASVGVGAVYEYTY